MKNKKIKEAVTTDIKGFLGKQKEEAVKTAFKQREQHPWYSLQKRNAKKVVCEFLSELKNLIKEDQDKSSYAQSFDALRKRYVDLKSKTEHTPKEVEQLKKLEQFFEKQKAAGIDTGEKYSGEKVKSFLNVKMGDLPPELKSQVVADLSKSKFEGRPVKVSDKTVLSALLRKFSGGLKSKHQEREYVLDQNTLSQLKSWYETNKDKVKVSVPTPKMDTGSALSGKPKVKKQGEKHTAKGLSGPEKFQRPPTGMSYPEIEDELQRMPKNTDVSLPDFLKQQGVDLGSIDVDQFRDLKQQHQGQKDKSAKAEMASALKKMAKYYLFDPQSPVYDDVISNLASKHNVEPEEIVQIRDQMFPKGFYKKDFDQIIVAQKDPKVKEFLEDMKNVFNFETLSQKPEFVDAMRDYTRSEYGEHGYEMMADEDEHTSGATTPELTDMFRQVLGKAMPELVEPPQHEETPSYENIQDFIKKNNINIKSLSPEDFQKVKKSFEVAKSKSLSSPKTKEENLAKWNEQSRAAADKAMASMKLVRPNKFRELYLQALKMLKKSNPEAYKLEKEQIKRRMKADEDNIWRGLTKDVSVKDSFRKQAPSEQERQKSAEMVAQSPEIKSAVQDEEGGTTSLKNLQNKVANKKVPSAEPDLKKKNWQDLLAHAKSLSSDEIPDGDEMSREEENKMASNLAARGALQQKRAKERGEVPGKYERDVQKGLAPETPEEYERYMSLPGVAQNVDARKQAVIDLMKKSKQRRLASNESILPYLFKEEVLDSNGKPVEADEGEWENSKVLAKKKNFVPKFKKNKEC